MYRDCSMYVDIHICCEYRLSTWFNGDYFMFNPWYEEFGDDNEYTMIPIYAKRNYDLFATLADVKNRGGIIPISAPRGLPDDIHKVTKQLVDEYGNRGFSHSYFTLRELLDYMDTAPICTYSGWITKEEAKDLDLYHIYPNIWLSSSNSENYVKRTWTVPNNHVNVLVDAMKKRLIEIISEINHGTTKELNDTEIKRIANDFRIVFWFTKKLV